MLRRSLGPFLALGVLLAVALTSCGSEDASSTTNSVADEPATTTTANGAPTGPAVDGELALTAGRGGVTLTVTAGTEALVVLADLSLATVEAEATAWSVVVARPDGPRSSTADLPDAFDAVLVLPGDAVDVGLYELGPRPPTKLSLCLEVVPSGAVTEAGAATGDQVLLAARPGPTASLCATTTIG